MGSSETTVAEFSTVQFSSIWRVLSSAAGTFQLLQSLNKALLRQSLCMLHNKARGRGEEIPNLDFVCGLHFPPV